MNARVHRMSYAANMGLSRLRCRRCNEDTLHRGQACIHCGERYEAAPVTHANLTAKEVMALETLVKQRRRQPKARAR